MRYRYVARIGHGRLTSDSRLIMRNDIVALSSSAQSRRETKCRRVVGERPAAPGVCRLLQTSGRTGNEERRLSGLEVRDRVTMTMLTVWLTVTHGQLVGDREHLFSSGT